jgi:hypothetical protein
MSVRHAIKGFETHMHDNAAQARGCTEMGGPVLYFAFLDAQAEVEARYAALDAEDFAEFELARTQD